MAKKPALTPEEAKKEALGTALTTIEHKYGKGAVMRLSDHPAIRIPVIPTGSIGLDLALGVGGIPRGRITEIYGPESSGKRLSRCTSSLNARSAEAPAPSSTPNTLSTWRTPAPSASTLTT